MHPHTQTDTLSTEHTLAHDPSPLQNILAEKKGKKRISLAIPANMDGKGEAWSGSEAAEKNPKSFAFPHYHSKKSQPKSFLTSPRIHTHTHTLAVKVLSNNNRYFLPIFLSLSLSLSYTSSFSRPLLRLKKNCV